MCSHLSFFFFVVVKIDEIMEKFPEKKSQPELPFMFKYQEEGRIEIARTFLEEALLPSFSQWLVGQKEKSYWRLGAVFAAGGVGKTRFAWELIPMMLKLLKNNDDVIVRFSPMQTPWNQYQEKDRQLLIDCLENARLIYLDVRRNGDKVEADEFSKIKSVSSMLGARIAFKFWGLSSYDITFPEFLKVVEKNPSKFSLPEVLNCIRHLLPHDKPSMLFVGIDEIHSVCPFPVPKATNPAETENLGRAFHRALVSYISQYQKSMNFFVHGCLVGTAETRKNLQLDTTDNPIIPIQLLWLPRQSVENIVRSDFENGSELLKSNFFLRILTLAGGNARLLEGLRQTLEENPLSINLISKWMDVSESRFSVDVTGKWPKSIYKMALLLAMTGIRVEMDGDVSILLIEPTTNRVIESLMVYFNVVNFQMWKGINHTIKK